MPGREARKRKVCVWPGGIAGTEMLKAARATPWVVSESVLVTFRMTVSPTFTTTVAGSQWRIVSSPTATAWSVRLNCRTSGVTGGEAGGGGAEIRNTRDPAPRMRSTMANAGAAAG